MNQEKQETETMAAQPETVAEKDADNGAAAVAAEYGEAMRKFSAEYPEIKELSEEVAQAILEGETPSSAYLKYENRRLKARLAAQERDRENREKAFGSALGSAEGGESDPFLSGFDAAFKD